MPSTSRGPGATACSPFARLSSAYQNVRVAEVALQDGSSSQRRHIPSSFHQGRYQARHIGSKIISIQPHVRISTSLRMQNSRGFVGVNYFFPANPLLPLSDGLGIRRHGSEALARSYLPHNDVCVSWILGLAMVEIEAPSAFWLGHVSTARQKYHARESRPWVGRVPSFSQCSISARENGRSVIGGGHVSR